MGRFLKFLNLCDPRTLYPQFFFNMSFNKSLEILRNKSSSNDILWLAHKIKYSTINPDNNKIIPIPFRMSGFVLCSAPILCGCLLPNPTRLTTIIFQWLNQTHNAFTN